MRSWAQKLLDLWSELGTWNQYGLAVVGALLLLWLGLEVFAA